MNLNQYLLTKLAEEASEVAKISLKTQQFGFNEVCPGQRFTNAERLHQELDDLQAAIEMLNDVGLGYIPNPVAIETKKDKVFHYLKYSVGLGMVDCESLKEYEND